MWVRRGSPEPVNTTRAETNLAQSLTLSILEEEDGEKFLYPRLSRLHLSVRGVRGPGVQHALFKAEEEWGDFYPAVLYNHIMRR